MSATMTNNILKDAIRDAQAIAQQAQHNAHMSLNDIFAIRASMSMPPGGPLHSSPYAPPQPPVKPDDPDMMNFVALDDLQLSHDELTRQKLATKRREMLKTDLTWKQVVLEKDEKKRFDGNEGMLIGIVKTLGYEYVCTKGKVYHIIKNPIFEKTPPPGPNEWIWEDTGLVEDDVNEIL